MDLGRFSSPVRGCRGLLLGPAEGGGCAKPDSTVVAVDQPGKTVVPPVLRGVPWAGSPRGRTGRGVSSPTSGGFDPDRATTLFPGRGRGVSDRQRTRKHAGMEGRAEHRRDLGPDQLHPIPASLGSRAAIADSLRPRVRRDWPQRSGPALSTTTASALEDQPDAAAVADVLERVGIQHHQIGQPASERSRRADPPSRALAPRSRWPSAALRAA